MCNGKGDLPYMFNINNIMLHKFNIKLYSNILSNEILLYNRHMLSYFMTFNILITSTKEEQLFLKFEV